jgi:hypothetical protein
MARVNKMTPVSYLGHINYIEILVSSIETNGTIYFLYNVRDTVNESKWGQLLSLLGKVQSFEQRLAIVESEIDNHPIMIELHNYKKHVNLFKVN